MPYDALHLPQLCSVKRPARNKEFDSAECVQQDIGSSVVFFSYSCCQSAGRTRPRRPVKRIKRTKKHILFRRLLVKFAERLRQQQEKVPKRFIRGISLFYCPLSSCCVCFVFPLKSTATKQRATSQLSVRRFGCVVFPFCLVSARAMLKLERSCSSPDW